MGGVHDARRSAGSLSGFLPRIDVNSTAPPAEPPYLVLRVMHGLGNRLRAYASAVALAGALGRRLALVWELDIHCSAHMHDLFSLSGGVPRRTPPLAGAPEGVPVFDAFDLEALEGRGDVEAFGVTRPLSAGAQPAPATDAHAPPERRSAGRRRLNLRRHIMLQSSSRVTSTHDLGLPRGSATPPQDASKEIDALRSLAPAERVLRILRELEGEIAVKGTHPPPDGESGRHVQRPNLLGIHVRMEANLSVDVPNIEQHEADGAINRNAMGGNGGR